MKVLAEPPLLLGSPPWDSPLKACSVLGPDLDLVSNFLDHKDFLALASAGPDALAVSAPGLTQEVPREADLSWD